MILRLVGFCNQELLSYLSHRLPQWPQASYSRQFQCNINWSAHPNVKYCYIANGPNSIFEMPCVQHISVWNNDVENSLVLAWRSGSGRKGQNHCEIQEVLATAGREANRQWMKTKGSCRAEAWGELLPLHILLPFSSTFHLMPQPLVQSWSHLPANSLQELCVWRTSSSQGALRMHFEMQLCNFYFGCTYCN